MTSGSVTAAMTRNLPPHLGQCSISILNTRLSGTSHGAQSRKAEPEDEQFLDRYLEWGPVQYGSCAYVFSLPVYWALAPRDCGTWRLVRVRHGNGSTVSTGITNTGI